MRFYCRLFLVIWEQEDSLVSKVLTIYLEIYAFSPKNTCKKLDVLVSQQAKNHCWGIEVEFEIQQYQQTLDCTVHQCLYWHSVFTGILRSLYSIQLKAGSEKQWKCAEFSNPYHQIYSGYLRFYGWMGDVCIMPLSMLTALLRRGGKESSCLRHSCTDIRFPPRE